MELIKLKEVNKQYRNKNILENINLDIAEGDLIGVIGQSGSGKTTLLNVIAGFIRPTSGEVVYVSKIKNQEKNLHKNLHRIKKHIGFTPQHNSFYHRLTIKENLIHFGKLYRTPWPKLKENIIALLKFTELFEHRNKLVEHLSGGMQKRLDISCSLVHRPKILIVDEPTADLDPISQRNILYLLNQVNKQGITVIIASHDHKGIEDICNKVVILHKNKVHTTGLLKDIKQPYLKNNFTINLLTNEEKGLLIEKMKNLSFQKIVDHGSSLSIHPNDTTRALQQIITLIKEENLSLHDIDLRQPSLTEIFETIAKKKN